MKPGGGTVAERVTLYEVGPRDGLQNEARVIPLAEKVALIDCLTASGLPAVEVGSFVSPRWVPQMADSGAVIAAIRRPPGVRLSVLVPNLKGWEAFRAATEGLDNPPGEVAVFVSASEGFSQANLNCSVAESIDRLRPVVAAAQAAGVALRGYVSCVTDCPFDGPVAPDRVARVAADLLALAAMPLSLGDTIGAGRPETVAAMLDAVLQVAPAGQLAGHFHDTGGRACDNIVVALDKGLRTFDAAVGGLGGCPYAPGAPGNVATGAVLDLLAARGFDTGVDRAMIDRAAAMAQAMRGTA
jgi:hydroxymethylglutaryl-CoA lyase